MNIGEAARKSGISTKMIRYYEQTGLIPAARRTESGYRIYSDQDVDNLRFIRRARDLGFSVERIAELLGLWRNYTRKSAEVKLLAQQHIAALRRKARELENMAAALETLAAACRGDHRPGCPILQDLADADEKKKMVVKRRRGAVGMEARV